MNTKRNAAILGFVTSGALLLGACGDKEVENNASSSSDTSTQAGASADSAANCEGKKALKASGSSAQNNAMTMFANAYSKACAGFKIDYNSVGSGAGVKDFIGNQTDFGGSDSPLKEDQPAGAKERCSSDAWHLPIVFGPIAVAFNVEGVENLTLSADSIAKIFSGKITKWNDAQIAKENEGASLPDADIVVISRSDKSGTTDNFQKYLSSAAEASWTGGAGKEFVGGVGEGAKGNEGVSGAVKDTANSITYTEWSFAKQLGLGITKVVTSAGPEAVELSIESVGKTIDGAKFKNSGNDLVLDTSSFYKPTVAGSYPIVLPTYEIVCSNYADADTAKAVKSFLDVATNADVQGKLNEKGYIPIPDAFRTKVKKAISDINA